MANFRRRRPRTTSSGNNTPRERKTPSWYRYAWWGTWPRWHDLVFHTRPRRARTRALENRVLHGADPDALVWPLSKKPHKYYW